MKMLASVHAVTFPPPIPPKSKILLEKYRERGRGKLHYENVPAKSSSSVDAEYGHRPVNEKSETPVYDVVQFSTRRIQEHERNQNATIDGDQVVKSQRQRVRLKDELESVLKTKSKHGIGECRHGNRKILEIEREERIEITETEIKTETVRVDVQVHRPAMAIVASKSKQPERELELGRRHEADLARDKPEDESELNAGAAPPSSNPRFATRAYISEENARNSYPQDEDLITEAEINRILQQEDTEVNNAEEKFPIPSPRRRNRDRDRSSTKSPSATKEVTFQQGSTPVPASEEETQQEEGNMELAGEADASAQVQGLQSQMKIHHVINLPPRKIQFIQKRRRRRKTEDLSYQKSARLSQLMMAEYKTADKHQRRLQLRRATIDGTGTDSKPGVGLAVGAAGRNMRRRLETWYQRRVKTPIMEQLSSGEAALLEGIHKLQRPFNFRCGCGPRWTRTRGSAKITQAHGEPPNAGQEGLDPQLTAASGSVCARSGAETESQFGCGFSEVDLNSRCASSAHDLDQDDEHNDVVDGDGDQVQQQQVRVLDRDHETAQGQNEFEDLRKLVKQGGDFCKDLSSVLQERSELESQYAKGLSKLSVKLLKASKEATGSVAHAWQAVAVQIDTQAELHRLWSTALLDEIAKPLRNSTETQHKIRKSVETLVEKTTRNLAEWRTAETKAKRQCFSNSKEFEKLQESSASAGLIVSPTGNNNMTLALALPNANHNGNGTASAMSNHSVLAEVRARSRILSVPHQNEKDPLKLETKRRKAEEAVRRADIEYYTFCVRAERARLEWEGSIRNGSTCLRTLEEEKLLLLKELALKYFQHFNEFIPKLVRSAESLEEPIRNQDIHQDMHKITDIRRHAGVEQLMPDFYAEDTSNLMQKDRRKEALQKFVYLIKQDLDRERKGSVGIENLARAIAEATKVDNAHHDISDKVYYMKSMLLYLEGARYKIENALADLEGRQRSNNPITQYMRYQRDKQGLPQTVLKVPSWARDECISSCAAATSSDSVGSDSPDWHECDRGAADGTSKNHDTDFEDEFSSEGSGEHIEEVFEEVTKASNLVNAPSIGRCRVIYDYESNMFDELTIRTGEVINVHDKQEDGWWLGELNGVIGIFPATYVEEVGKDGKDEGASAVAVSPKPIQSDVEPVSQE